MLGEMNSKEALIEVSKSCKALAREFGDKMYKRDAKALNVLKDTILENAKLKKAIEVLEIIKKKEINIGELSYYIDRYSDEEIDYILEQYNRSFSKPYQLTIEELLKLKQWLEGNE